MAALTQVEGNQAQFSVHQKMLKNMHADLNKPKSCILDRLQLERRALEAFWRLRLLIQVCRCCRFQR